MRSVNPGPKCRVKPLDDEFGRAYEHYADVTRDGSPMGSRAITLRRIRVPDGICPWLVLRVTKALTPLESGDLTLD
jgi:hypothetical protein